jgi:hypothetical protein
MRSRRILYGWVGKIIFHNDDTGEICHIVKRNKLPMSTFLPDKGSGGNDRSLSSSVLVASSGEGQHRTLA